MSNYKQSVADFYNSRTDYDNDFTRDRALRLVEYAPLKSGDSVLDVATGTGIVAISAAAIVGSQGHVIGIDIATELLSQAQHKVAVAGLQNIDLIEADAEEYEFQFNQFDAILCSSAIVLLIDIPAILRKWCRFLKSDGFVAFSCYSATSFLTPVIAEVCCRTYGITLPEINGKLGTPERCQRLLNQAGFQTINIYTEQRGSYLTLEQAKNRWDGQSWLHPDNPFLQLAPEQIQCLKAEYDLATHLGRANNLFCGCAEVVACQFYSKSREG